MTSDLKNRSTPAGRQPLTAKPSKPSKSTYANCPMSPDGSAAVPMKVPVSPKPFGRSVSQTTSPSPPFSGSPTDKKSPQTVSPQASWASKSSSSSSRRLSESGAELAIPQLISPTHKKPPPLDTCPRPPVTKASVPTPAPPSQAAVRKKMDTAAAQADAAQRSSSTAWSMPTPLTSNQRSTSTPSLHASSSFTVSEDEDFPPDLPPPRPANQPSPGSPSAYVVSAELAKYYFKPACERDLLASFSSSGRVIVSG